MNARQITFSYWHKQEVSLRKISLTQFDFMTESLPENNEVNCSTA